jgi:hypothetical protein
MDPLKCRKRLGHEQITSPRGLSEILKDPGPFVLYRALGDESKSQLRPWWVSVLVLVLFSYFLSVEQLFFRQKSSGKLTGAFFQLT